MQITTIELDGKKYMSTSFAAKHWGVTQNTVSQYCRQGRIYDCFQDEKKRWFISIDEIKPLKDDEIKRILFLSLQLKNNPSLPIDWSTFDFDEKVIDIIYRNLANEKYIMEFNCSDKKKIPYEIVLTQKGMEKVFSVPKDRLGDFKNAVHHWLPIVISITELIHKIAATA